MDITATFQLSPTEFRSAIRRAPAMRRSRVVFVIAVLLGILELAVGRHYGYYFIAGGVFGPVIFDLAIRKSTKRSANLIAAPWTVRLTDRTYSLSTPVSRAEVDWSAYAEVTARSGFWYLSQANRAVFILPQRAFDDAQREELTAFFATRLPPRKRPWYRLF